MNIMWINKISSKEYWRTTQVGLSNSLRKRKHHVTLVMAREIGEKKPADKETIYLPTIPYPVLSGLFFGLLLFFSFPFFIRNQKPDIIIIDGTSVWLPFTLTLKLFHVPLVMDIRTLPIKKKSPPLFDICLYFSKYVTNALTTITPELAAVLRTKYDLDGQKIGIWSSGVSLEDFTVSCSKTAATPYHPDKFVILHHGSYSSTRGVKNLIMSIGQIQDALRKRIELILIGVHEKDQKEFLQLCNEEGITEQVTIMSRVPYRDIPSYIQSSDIGVIPLPPDRDYWKVSVPLKTLEYMAMEKPIIATAIPFHQRIFEQGNCGVLLDTNNPKALVHAITYLYRHREELTKMGRVGRELVSNHYTWDCIASEFEQFIKTVLVDFQDES